MDEEKFKDAIVEVENVLVPAADVKVEMRTISDLEEMYEDYYDDGAALGPLYDARTRMSFLVYADKDRLILYDAQE